jgi:hypothetical protein
MKTVRRDEPVKVRLKTSEQKLLLEETILDGELLSRVSIGEPTSATSVSIRLTPDQLNGVLECVAAAANHASSRALEKRLDALYDRLEAVENDLDVIDV